MSDYAYIRKELLRNGVSKKLLWTEYLMFEILVPLQEKSKKQYSNKKL